MSINGIEVTDVIVFPVKNKVKDSLLAAFARVILNDQFILNGIKIFKGKNGPFIQFPQELDRKIGKGLDICFPITAEMRTYISDQVLSQYSIAAIALKSPEDKIHYPESPNGPTGHGDICHSDADPGL